GTPNRWGDTFSVRGSETFPQILLGSRTGIVASVISPSFGVNSMPLVIRTDADAGNFGLGIAFGADDSFWGKAPALPLRLIQYDGGAGTGNTIANFGNYQNMGPIGVDLANGL